MKQLFFYIITFAYAFSTFSNGILLPVYAFFVLKLGGGILETSWAIGLYSIVTGLGTIIIHKTSWSHNNAKHCLWGGWFLWLLSVLIYLIMDNLALLYLSQLFNGLGSALSEPVFDAEFTKQIKKDDLSGGWAFFEGMINIFSGFASLIGGFLVTKYGFSTLINCNIAVAILSFTLIIYYTYHMKESLV